MVGLVCLEIQRRDGGRIRLRPLMLTLPMFLAAFLRPRFEPEVVRDDKRKRNQRQTDYHQPTVALFPATFLGFQGRTLGVLGSGLR
jgi:hypothetical protein